MSDSSLPLLPLRRGVVLPGRVSSLPVGRRRSVALTRSLRSGDHLYLGVQHDASVEQPTLADLHRFAVRAVVREVVDRGRRGLVLVVEGLERVQLERISATEPFLRAVAQDVEETQRDTDEATALAESLRAYMTELASDEALKQSLLDAAPGDVADRVTTWIDVPHDKKIEVLLTLDVVERLRFVVDLVKEAKARAELRLKVESQVRGELGKQQKEALLRQQLKAIQKELGELGEDGEEDDPVAQLEARLGEIEFGEDVQKVVDRELRRLRTINPQSPESNIIRTYLETIADLPWNDRAPAMNDLDEVHAKLEADHFGLEDVKRRILEHMAVLKLAPQARGTVLALVGPPGVGKTSLAQSVADATGRPLVRVALGGIRDEAEIRGHRRTYVGALPGRVVSALRKAKVKNPVVVLDEIDKVTRGGWSGDPEAALLEVLDPEQNERFTDHYLELPFDLSEVLFIATANEIGNLSLPLRDRLEIIEVTGYTLEEKVEIAKRHLLPKQLDRHGLSEETVGLDEDLLRLIARDYTREAGVRQLEREIGKVLRSVALRVARSTVSEKLVIDEKAAREILGRARFLADAAERERPAGVAAGLAWTPVGGDVLYVETTKMPGKGKVEITGQLGDVMNESARAALAYVRTHAGELGIDPAFLEANDLHVHVPAGAVPKDGPSAGVTMFTAFASLLSGNPIRPDTAMTGEATLRGRVLPVGGIKSKVLAAHRAGFGRVILPKKNGVDLDEVPETVREQMEFVLVDDMRQVFDAAFEAKPTPPLSPTDPGTFHQGANPAA